MKRTVYTAWVGYDDFRGCCTLSDTIKCRSFTDGKKMRKWIRDTENRILKEYGISREDYENEFDVCFAIYGDSKKQVLTF